MRNIFLFFFICITLSFSVTVFAQAPEYQPVVQIPGLDPNNQDTNEYVNALYLLAISVGALLAVVKIIFGGVKYMLSDIVTDKGQGIKDIQGALLGLLIILATVIILNTINPNLTKINFLQNADPLSITLSGPDNTSVPGVNVGDFHGMWCGNIFTLVCDSSHTESLELFKKGCVEGGGVIVEKFLDGYVCSKAN
jgi:hypothetical protein